MSRWKALLGLYHETAAVPAAARPQASGAQSITVNTAAELEQVLRFGMTAGSGQVVTPESALRVAAVMACVRLRAGALANMPVGIKERVNDRTRADRSEHPVWRLMMRRPNKWQKPAQFKRMLEAHVLLRGDGFAAITRGVGGVPVALTPLHPDRVEVKQAADLTLEYIWTRKDGSRVQIAPADMFHLMGLTLDGIRGVSPMTFMRETIGLALSQDAHGSAMFRNSAQIAGAFKLPAGKTLGQDQHQQLKADLDEFRQGGAREGKVILLEDGLEYQQLGMTSEDAQWIEARKFSRGDIAMFFGVPPHMIGDTEKATSWGTGLETQGQGFVTYTLEDSLTAWEEAIGADLLDWERNPQLFARFNRNALVRGDIKTRWEAHVKAMQWGVMSPNEVRELEDMNPRDGGDIYYDPPNTAGDATKDQANVNP